MNQKVIISGLGAVSPAGWGVAALQVASGEPLPAALGSTPGKVPPLESAPAWVKHPRFRRASPLSKFAAAAAMEALGPARASLVQQGGCRLGIVFSVVNGCVAYSGKFYGEVLADPGTASPILFPETVFNAPASHLAAFLNVTGPVCSLVGDPAQYFAALDMAALWLEQSLVDACLVIGAEEADWLTSHAADLLLRGLPIAEGAGCLLLERGDHGVTLQSVAQHSVHRAGERAEASRALRATLTPWAAGTLLVDDLTGHVRTDRATLEAWSDWTGPRCAPLQNLGHGLGASVPWQSVLAAHAVATGLAPEAIAVAHGTSHQIGLAHFRSVI